MITDSEGTSLSAIASWLLAIILLLVGLTVGEPRGSGMIDPAVVGFTIFLIVCVPIFCVGIILGSLAIMQRQPWGYGGVLLNLIVMVTLVFLHLHPTPTESPKAQAKRIQRAQERERSAQKTRENGGISLSESSPVYRIVTAPGWRLGCASVIGIMTLIWAGHRLVRLSAVRLPRLKSAPNENLSTAHCPKCQANLTQVLATGGSVCPACGIQFVMARSDSTDAPPMRESALASLLFDGPAVQRLSALLCVSLIGILGLVWVGLILAGQWNASKNVLVVMFLLTLLLGAILAHYARRQN